MRDPLDPIEKVRMSDVLKVRVLPGFRERVVTVAATEGIGLAEFARRAIVERVRRLEGSEAQATEQPPTISASQPDRNARHARAQTNPTARQPASAATAGRRRDA
ncbi:MAG: hypothetical protein INR70_15695 [Parafilimonas terrae]|nr:hypothetical protein [Parafilimonas terrae]